MERLTDITRTADLLAEGQLVALPTDTVYGIGARLDRPRAVRQLFVAKGRPETVALPVLVRSLAEAAAVGASLEAAAVAVAERFWPGPLTMIVSASSALATLVGATDSVGLRFPADPLLEAILEQTGPLVVTSANHHGAPPCTTADEVLAVFGANAVVAAVLDGGTRNGQPSTVVDLRVHPVTVLRAGPISEADVRAAL